MRPVGVGINPPIAHWISPSSIRCFCWSRLIWPLGVKLFATTRRNDASRRMSTRARVEHGPSLCSDQSSNMAGNCPALKSIVGWSSNSPSSASPDVEKATTPSLVADRRSAMRRAASSDLHGTAWSAFRLLPRPALKLWTTKTVSRAIARTPREAGRWRRLLWDRRQSRVPHPAPSRTRSRDRSFDFFRFRSCSENRHQPLLRQLQYGHCGAAHIADDFRILRRDGREFVVKPLRYRDEPPAKTHTRFKPAVLIPGRRPGLSARIAFDRHGELIAGHGTSLLF